MRYENNANVSALIKMMYGIFDEDFGQNCYYKYHPACVLCKRKYEFKEMLSDIYRKEER